MFVVEAHVAIADVAVSSGDMRSFIVGSRIRPRGGQGEAKEDCKHDGYDDCGVMLDGLDEMIHSFES